MRCIWMFSRVAQSQKNTRFFFSFFFFAVRRARNSQLLTMSQNEGGSVTSEPTQSHQFGIDVPRSFVDSVFSFEIMRDPVSTPAGHTFEREGIEHWIGLHGTCPITRAALATTDLVPNRALRDAIAEFFKGKRHLERKLERMQSDRRRLFHKLNVMEQQQREKFCRFLDPINRAVMERPVVAADGHTYSRRSIELWLRNQKEAGQTLTSPVTREPLRDDALRPDVDLAREIDEWLESTRAEGSGSSAGDEEEENDDVAAGSVASVGNLSKIFAVLDNVADDLQECLDSWEPPRVTVMGDQSHGKSTILERLCLMPLFPTSRALCTSVPVKINIRRTATPLPASLQLWDTDRNEPMGKPRLVPMDDGHVDVRDAMADAIRGQICDVAANRELRLSIHSATLPPMNLVDLPGLVQHPRALREATHSLLQRYLGEHDDSSIFLVVVRADTSPRTSESIRIVMDRELQSRTVGVLTFCDKLDTDEDHELLRQVLANSDEARECVPLQPYGYVATTNRRSRKKIGAAQAPGSNRSRLLAQARNEIRWFEDEGYAQEVADAKVSTAALIHKIGMMYSKYVLDTFVPQTIRQILRERRRHDHARQLLGLPASPGLLADPVTLVAGARRYAENTFGQICAKHSTLVLTTVLPGFSATLTEVFKSLESLPAMDLPAYLQQAATAAAQATVAAIRDVNRLWDENCLAMWEEDPLPFRPQRFPAFVDAMREFSATNRPSVPENHRDSLLTFVRNAVAPESYYTKLKFTFAAQNKTVSASFPDLVQSIVGAFICRLSMPSSNGINDICDQLFGQPESQLKESCHARRQELLTKLARLERAALRLLHVTQSFDKDDKSVGEDVFRPADAEPMTFEERICAAFPNLHRVTDLTDLTHAAAPAEVDIHTGLAGVGLGLGLGLGLG